MSCKYAHTALAGLLLLAVGLRAWAFPHRYYQVDVDEIPYVEGGLQVLEGLPPPYHYAPDGPETWVGWAVAGVRAAQYFVFPTAEERVPLEVRPYTAVNHALFDLYRDLSGLRLLVVVLSMALSLAAVMAAFRLGLRQGGLGGAVLLGGLAAALPALVANSAMAKPYSAAWSFAILAAYFAAGSTSPRRRLLSAVCLGLAVASRVEMLLLIPLGIAESWASGMPRDRRLKATVKYVASVIVSALVAAPWLVTNLIGNLRAIATIYFGPAPTGPLTRAQTLWDLGWNEALALPAVFVVVGIVFAAWDRIRRTPGDVSGSEPVSRSDAAHPAWRWVVVAYAMLLFTTAFKSTGYGIRHQGPAVLALLLAAPIAARPLFRAGPRVAWMGAGLALVLATGRSAWTSYVYRRDYVPDEATTWVEQHVAPGTIVYLSPGFREPLPTPESADAMWDEVSNPTAAKRKFDAGLERFKLSHIEMPRAVDWQQTVTERGIVRRLYILGSRCQWAGPRFDIRRFKNSGTFGLADPVPSFKETGGVLIWRGEAIPGLGPAAVQWTDAKGNGTYVYELPQTHSAPATQSAGASGARATTQPADSGSHPTDTGGTP